MHKACSDTKSYQNKARSLLFNLKDPANPQLRQKIVKGELTADKVVMMEPSQLASEAKQDERHQHLKQNLEARRTDW